jgi:hypothetical protein
VKRAGGWKIAIAAIVTTVGRALTDEVDNLFEEMEKGDVIEFPLVQLERKRSWLMKRCV